MDRSFFSTLSEDDIKIIDGNFDREFESVELEKLRLSCMDNPLVKELLSKFSGLYYDNIGTKVAINTVRDVLATKQACAYILSDSPDDHTLFKRQNISPLELAWKVTNSVPYKWTDEMWKAATSCSLPRHIIAPDVMPFPWLWFTFDHVKNGILGIGIFNDTKILIQDTGERYGAMEIFVVKLKVDKDGDPYPSCIDLTVKFGTWYPDKLQNPEDVELVGNILNALSFINSPYITKMVQGPNRNERRSLGLKQKSSNEVHFIDLRRPHVIGQKQSKEHGTVAWSCHWAVGQYRRLQWYPSEKVHRLIWVKPHLKGDLTKPLKESVYLVRR